MACKNICKLCKRLIISNSVTLAGDGSLLINIPAGSYLDGEKYCIVIAQNIPTAATINARAYITVGTGSQSYPLVTKCCELVTASMLHTRTKYSTVVVTNTSGANFKLLGDLCNTSDRLQAVDGTN